MGSSGKYPIRADRTRPGPGESSAVECACPLCRTQREPRRSTWCWFAAALGPTLGCSASQATGKPHPSGCEHRSSSRRRCLGACTAGGAIPARTCLAGHGEGRLLVGGRAELSWRSLRIVRASQLSGPVVDAVLDHPPAPLARLSSLTAWSCRVGRVSRDPRGPCARASGPDGQRG